VTFAAMAKLLLISLLGATIVIPIVASRRAPARRGLRRTVTWTIAFLAAYVLACAFVYARLL